MVSRRRTVRTVLLLVVLFGVSTVAAAGLVWLKHGRLPFLHAERRAPPPLPDEITCLLAPPPGQGPAVEAATRGLLALQRGRLDVAEEAFRLAATLDPDDARLFLDLGVVLRREGEYEDALRAFQKAHQLDPGWADPHFDRAVVLAVDLGRVEEAVLALERYAEAGGLHEDRMLRLLSFCRRAQDRGTDRNAVYEDYGELPPEYFASGGVPGEGLPEGAEGSGDLPPTGDYDTYRVLQQAGQSESVRAMLQERLQAAGVSCPTCGTDAAGGQ